MPKLLKSKFDNYYRSTATLSLKSDTVYHYETYARGWYLPKLLLALIDKDLIEAEVVNSTYSRFKKLIFSVKNVTFI